MAAAAHAAAAHAAMADLTAALSEADSSADDELVVGSAVLVNNKHKAIVRYIGPTSFADGVWYGLELEREIGKHEGTVLGITYFTTPKKRGTFVKRESLTLYDAEVEASARMQSAMRMSLAKKKAKAEVSWRAFNALDADEENRIMARRQRLLNSALGARLARDRPTLADLDRWEAEALACSVEADYAGPVVTLPLTLPQVVAMVEAFKAGKTLHYKYAVPLIAAYRRYADELPTLVDVVVEPGTTLTICGDTHGQLQDLFSIFTINGVPSPTNRYLMNGDFVDRGEHSCEVMLCLMAYCLLYPGEWGTSKGAGCILNRGNHESHNQNVTGGFMTEVLDKYSAGGDGSDAERGLRVYDGFQAAFDAMPIAHVISAREQRIFVVHGGLMQHPGVTLAHVAALNRKREIPYGYPGFEDKLYEDLMWSDPRAPDGTTPSDRGAGVFFGPDVTAAFCAANAISLVVRSHECVPEGFAFMHDNKYCGRGTNRGAYLILEPDLRLTIHQFVAVPLEVTAPALEPPKVLSEDRVREYDMATPIDHDLVISVQSAGAKGHLLPSVDDDSEARQVEAVKRMIMERVVLHKPDLYFYWAAVDRTGAQDGTITKVQWAEGMRTILNLDISWLSLVHQLADVDPATSRINYSRFLDRYRITMREKDVVWMEAIVERACEKLFAACHTLEAAYAYFDVDHSGVIEFEELERGLMRMDVGLSRSQLVELMNTIDEDGDGRIQYSEFANRFRLVFSRVKDDASVASGKTGDEDEDGGGSGEFDEWTEDALHRIGVALLSTSGGNISSAFTSIDRDGDGLLSEEEFRLALRGMGLPFTDAEVHKLLDAIDANHSGQVNFREFASAFRVTDGAAAAGALQIFSASAAAGEGVALLSPVAQVDHGASAAAGSGTAASAAAGSGSGRPTVAVDGASPSVPPTRIASGGGGSPPTSGGSPRVTPLAGAAMVTAGADSAAAGGPVALAPMLTTGPPAGADGAAAGAGAGRSFVPPPLIKRHSKDNLLRKTGSRRDINAAASAELAKDTGRTWQHGVIEQVVAMLFEYRMEMAAAFRMFDSDGNGVISREEFRSGLKALTSVSGSPITDMQCDEMLRVLDTDGNGEISWTEFVNAFRLIDSGASEPAGAAASPTAAEAAAAAGGSGPSPRIAAGGAGASPGAAAAAAAGGAGASAAPVPGFGASGAR